MAHPKETNKEIPLFEEKSIRDEAYRQKILQLEKEISRLETIAKTTHYNAQKSQRHPEYQQHLHYDAVSHFDRRARREDEYLEKRASELTERLNVQAQRLALSIESTVNHKLRWMIFSTIAVIAFLVILFAAAFFFFRNNAPLSYSVENATDAGYDSAADTNQHLSYIKSALQNKTKYRHLYFVNYVNRLEGGIYVAEIELESEPRSKWFLKDICTEIAGVFKKYAASPKAEFYFVFDDKPYMKAYLRESTPKLRLQYLY